MTAASKKVHLVSLGCAKNQVDAERVLHQLGLGGFRLSPKPEGSHLVVVNTCAFIRSAEEEAVEALLAAAALKRGNRIRVLLATGCLVARHGAEKLKKLIPELDAAFLPSEANQVAKAAQSLLGMKRSLPVLPQPGRVLLSGSGSAFLKIAEGCSRRCAYCLIPALRGPLKSETREALLQEAEGLARRGAGELIVVAQDITAYGRDLKPRVTLAALLDGLVKIRALRWIRLMYAYPDLIGEDLIRRVASEKKICKYLDMPVQHSQKQILRRMGRPGEGQKNLALVARLRRRIPGIVLRTTLLTGFPGETETDHDALKKFVREAEFDRLGVFAFSREQGTLAAAWPGQVPFSTKARRRRELMELQSEISARRLAQRVGQIVECLVEESAGEGLVLARTSGDAPEVDGGIVLRGHARPGTFVRARVTRSTDHDLVGEIL